ncbi:TonB-dependent receptor [Sphingomonas bacterium]|uniref:TonB-dependent receptor n=1 Tax=Sphingomonas bacterium TaxID=1895847 RepID=UPI0026343964|nr:TonB-dependent receptor [Sphingomonas bacterium]
MISNSIKALRAGTALRALALLGAGVSGSAMFAAPAYAQDYTNVAATGKVQGTNGEAVAGATVEIRSDDQGFSRTATTDSSGTFRIQQIPPGSYTFTITAPGFDTFTESGVTLNQSSAANQFTLSAVGAPVGGDIVVTAGRVRTVDFDRNTTGAVINVGDLATRVPVARDITSVVLLSPGTSAGDTAFGNLPSINGGSVSENAYFINGLNITQFRNGLGSVPVPFDFYQTVEVKNGGLSAEFGRSTGGFVNATTKSGSNDFHGSVTFNWEPNELLSKAPNSAGSDRDSFYNEREDMIVQLSGPIIKDHLFFYGIYNARNVIAKGGTTGTASAIGTGANGCATNPTFCTDFADLRSVANLTLVGSGYTVARSTSPFFGAKIDAVIIDGQRLEGTYFNTKGNSKTDLYGSALYTLASGDRFNPNTNNPGRYVSSSVSESGGENYVLRYTGTFTNWLTLSAAYGVNQNRSNTQSTDPSIPFIADQRGGGSLSIGNSLSNADISEEKRTFYRADVDLNFNFLGSHHIRGGYDREDLDLTGLITANGGFQYTLATSTGDATTRTPAGTQYAIARTFISGGQFNTRNEAFYLQDSWSLFGNRVQLNLGIRNDRFVNRNADGVAFYTSGDQWGPRLGFSADPFGDGRTKVYGSFNRYFLPVASNTNLRLAGSELDFDAYYRLTGLNANNTPILGTPITTGAGFEACPGGSPAGTACVVRNDGRVPGTATTVAANLKSQSTDEFILGVEQRLGNGIRVGLFGTYTKLNDSLEDAALDQAIIPLCVAAGNSGAACTAIFNGVHQYALINPGRDVTITLSDPFPNQTTAQTVTLSAAALGYPAAKRTYKAVTATFEREFDGVWSFNANYTWSKNEGNIEGGIRSDNAQTDSGLTTAFDLPALTNGSFGFLPNDRRHNFKAYGSVKITDWLTVGAQAQIASPRRFGCLGRTPISADATPFAVGGLAGRFYGAGGFYCNLDSSGNVVRNPATAVINDSPFLTGGAANPAARASTLQLTPRGSIFESDWLYNLNLDAAIRVPTDAFDATFRVSVFNVLNRQAKLDFTETGTTGTGVPNPTYSLPTVYQAPRSVRLQFQVGF